MIEVGFSLDTIEVDVRFYDDAEKSKLMRYPSASVMQEIVATPLKIPKAEFLTYYLFHRIKLGAAAYRDYKSIAQNLHHWLSAIGECIDYDEGSVRTPHEITQQLNEVSEHIGEAIGLSVMNRIHGLTEADWSPIPEQKGRNAKPSFDFRISSDGTRFIQVETKGSSVKDNRELSDAIKAQKRNIDAKKAKLFVLGEKGLDPNPANLRYGTIAAVDARKNGNVRCLLTDPPADHIDDDPASFRLLTRMSRLRDWICFLSPRSPLASALATRVADLESLKNLFELDGVPLLRGPGESFKIEPYGVRNRQHSTFMASKSRVTDGPVGGVIFQLSKQELFFFGIKESILVMSANQNFKEITHYKLQVDTREKTVDCTLSVGRYRSLVLPPSTANSATKVGGYVHFRLRGNLNYSSEGLVFGILPLPEK